MSRPHNDNIKRPRVWKRTCSKTWVSDRDHHRHSCELQPRHKAGHHCTCGETTDR